MKISSLFVLFWIASFARPSQGQTVSRGANKLGLDIESASGGPQKATVQVSLRNTSAQPITAFVIRLRATYSDGSQSSTNTTSEFFPSIGLPIPNAVGPGGLGAGARADSVLSYQLPSGKSLAGLGVEVAAVVFNDRSAVGDAEAVSGIFADRATESDEIDRWWRHMPDLADRALEKSDLATFLASRASEAKLLQDSAHQAAVRSRVQRQLASTLTSAFVSAGQHGALPDALKSYLGLRCAAAKEHSVQKIGDGK